MRQLDLTNCHQNIKVNLFFSGLYKIEYGMPQGNCLGPIIFLAYISQLFLQTHCFHLKRALSQPLISFNTLLIDQ